jgi:hypothetical protein
MVMIRHWMSVLMRVCLNTIDGENNAARRLLLMITCLGGHVTAQDYTVINVFIWPIIYVFRNWIIWFMSSTKRYHNNYYNLLLRFYAVSLFGELNFPWQEWHNYDTCPLLLCRLGWPFSFFISHIRRDNQTRKHCRIQRLLTLTVTW